MLLEGKIPTAFTVKNTSGKPVVSFTLGCVVIRREGFEIVAKLPLKEFSIAPGGSLDESIFDAPSLDEYQECVMKQKAKLALIFVGYEDKTSWTFSETGSEG